MNRKFLICSIIFVYIAFFISSVFASLTFKNWSSTSFANESDIANVQSIMDTLFYAPIFAFSIHVLLMAFIWYASRKGA